MISIIIPYFKAGKYALSLSESIARQTFTDFEIVVVDDSCGDSFEALFKSFSINNLLSKTLFISTLGYTGAANARNIAIANSSRKYIAFLDADDLWMPEYLDLMVNELIKKDIKLIVANVIFNHYSKRQIFLILPEVYTLLQLVQSCPFNISAIVLEKTLLDGLEFPCVKHEDYALWLILLKKIKFVTCLNKGFFVIINRVPNSLSSNKFKTIFWHWNVLVSYTNLSFFARGLVFVVYLINAILKRFQSIYRPVTPFSFIKNI
jgi:teichuronic acid biosynthesis glycosyltransferase TuaG